VLYQLSYSRTSDVTSLDAVVAHSARHAPTRSPTANICF
jgi:hypothetical protein